MSDDVYQFCTGAIEDPPDRRDYVIEDTFGAADMLETLPENYLVEGLFPIKNQNGFPSCVGQSTALCKQADEGVEISARSVYAKCKELDGNNSWGTTFRQAQKVMNQFGACEESLFPEDHKIPEEKYINSQAMSDEAVRDAAERRNESYYVIGKNRTDGMDYFDAVRRAIWKYKKPVVTGCIWNQDYYNMTASNYILPMPTGAEKGGHAFSCLGWRTFNGELQLIFQNSWGEGWGDKGRFYGGRDWVNEHAYNGWIHLDLPSKLPIDKRYYPLSTRYYKPDEPEWKPRVQALQETLRLAWLTARLRRKPSVREVVASVYGRWSPHTFLKNSVDDAWLYVDKMTWLRWKRQGTAEVNLAKVKKQIVDPNWDGKL